MKHLLSGKSWAGRIVRQAHRYALVVTTLGLMNQVFAVDTALTVRNIEELQATPVSGLSVTNGVLVLGYYSPGDRGGGVFRWSSSETNADGGRYITSGVTNTGRWVRMLNGETANVRMWGATADFNHNDTTNIQNALNACTDYWTEEMLFPAGSYKVTNTLVFHSHVHIRGEGSGNNTRIVMPTGIGKDIFRTKLADTYLTGGLVNGVDPIIPGQHLDHYIVFENLFIAFDGVEGTCNTSNSALVIFSPGEGTDIHNLILLNGGYGIRCLGGGAPGLRARNISAFNQAIGGISIESVVLNGLVEDGAGSVNLTGISGDYRYSNFSDTASLIRISNMVANVSVYNFKAEGVWGGGVIQYSTLTNAPAGYVTAGLHIHGGTYVGGPLEGQTDSPRDLVVLKGDGRFQTAAVHLEHVNLHDVRYLIRDEVSGRNVLPPDTEAEGPGQAAARNIIDYEAYNFQNGDPTNGVSSRLVIGGCAIYTFEPPTNGWYRILREGPLGRIGGRVIINGSQESSEFNVSVPFASATDAQINVLRPTTDPNGLLRPCVTKARAGTYYSGGIYRNFVDIFVERTINVTNRFNDEITIAYPLEGQNLIPETCALLTPVAPLVGGIPEPAGGTLLQCVTNSLTEPTFSGTGSVPPAQGGLGIDVSGVAADQFPYTTATGTFGFSTVTSFIRTLMDDSSASAARSTLQLVPGVDVQAYSTTLSSIGKIYKTSNQDFGTTVTDVTDMSFSVAASTDYGFEFFIVLSTSGTGQGYQLTLNGPTGLVELSAKVEMPNGSGSDVINNAMNSYGTLTTVGGGPGTSARWVARVTGSIRNGTTAGTFTLQARSQSVSPNGLTIKQGSWGQSWKLN